MECLSTKGTEAMAFSFPGKTLKHNSQTALASAVGYHIETVNEQGPSQCRSDTSFNEQMLAYRKSAPAFSFGPKSGSKESLNKFRTRTGATRKKVVRREAPRVEPVDDFQKYFGYNPNATQKDLDAYYGIKGKTLNETAPNLCLDYSTRPKPKRRAKRKGLNTQMGPKGQALKLNSRADSFIKFPPTPGPGRYNSASSLKEQRLSKSTSVAAYSFGTD